MNKLEEAERSAETHRSAFAIALEELDRRRKLATDIPYQLQTHATQVAMVAGAVALGVAGWVFIARLRSRHRAELRRKAWRKAALRAFEHPERIASRAKDRPLGSRIARQVALAFVAAVATQLARRTARVLLERNVLTERPLPARTPVVVS